MQKATALRRDTRHVSHPTGWVPALAAVGRPVASRPLLSSDPGRKRQYGLQGSRCGAGAGPQRSWRRTAEHRGALATPSFGAVGKPRGAPRRDASPIAGATGVKYQSVWPEALCTGCGVQATASPERAACENWGGSTGKPPAHAMRPRQDRPKLYEDRDVEAKRRSAHSRSSTRQHASRNAGLCTRGGQRPRVRSKMALIALRHDDRKGLMQSAYAIR